MHIIGAGLAGSEAAWQLAQRGVRVVLQWHPVRATEAHVTDSCAELVCSSSDDANNNVVGLLHEDTRRLDLLIMRGAILNKVPACAARLSAAVQAALERHPLIQLRREEIQGGRLAERHRCDGPPHLAVARRWHPQPHGRGLARLLRCDRRHRDRDTIDMGVASYSRYDKVGPAADATTSTVR